MTESGDSGVGVDGHLVCQNFEEHDDEIRMVPGPYQGVMCPDCGRFAGGPELAIPFEDDGDVRGGARRLARIEARLETLIEDWREMAGKQRKIGKDGAASSRLFCASEIEELLD